MNEKIVFAGNIIVDNVKVIPDWPRQGMLVKIDSFKRSLGGSALNTAYDLKTLDPSLDVKVLGKVGRDDNGDFALSVMSGRGLDVSEVGRADGPTTFTDVMTVSTTGARTFFNMHGADSGFGPEDIDVAKLDCGIFHLGYLLLLDAMDAPDEEYGTKAARLLAAVRARGIRTSLDIVSEQSERFMRIVRPALKHVDYCIINEIEASSATGRDPADMRGMCEALFELGVGERVVIHCPERSVTMGRAGDYAELGSLKLPEGWIVGSTGAGDAFCAGMLYSLLKGIDPVEGMRIASCAAAMNLTAVDSIGGASDLATTIALEKRFARR